MSEHLIVKIVSPDGIIFENHAVKSIELPTKTGVITILYDHRPIIAEIIPGEIVIEIEDETVYLSVSSGLLIIDKDNHIRLLADTAEKSEDIDIAKAEEAKKKAEELFSKEHLDQYEIEELQVLIQKEVARINVGSKRRMKHRSSLN